MSSYSKPLGLVWTRNPETPGIRLSAAVFGLVYPLLYFLTCLEDPGRAEPLWQYQLVGAVFLAVGAASFTAWGKQRLQELFHGALFAACAWSVLSVYLRGYEGTRFAVATVMFCGGLFVLSLRAMALYALMILGGMLLGVSLRVPLSANATQIMARVFLAAIVVIGITSIRLSIRDRETRRARSLRSIVQGSPVPTLLLANDVCQLANDAATRLLGISAGHNVREILIGEPPWWLSRELRGRAQAQLRARHGSELWCEVAFAPVEEQPHLIQVTLVDKTSDRDLSRIKDELLASISRELRPPLLSVKRALLASDSDGAQGGAGGAMRDLERIERLLEDMLLIHSLTGDAARDELRTYPAAEVCEQARALVKAHAESLGVTLSVHYPAESKLAVRTDMQAAGHALAILVTMALDAAAPGGWVTVRVEPQAPWIGYEVETESPRLERASPPSEEGGASLPLTIARSLVTRVGGLLDAEWPAEARKTLRVRLPAA
jgi:signal transduction histidine kinase